MRQQQGIRTDRPGRRRKATRGLTLAVAAVGCVWALFAAAAAQASVVSIGSVLPPAFTPTEFSRVQTFFNTALPEMGANLSSPVSGAVVRWRVQGAEGGPFYLRVLHPNGKGGYEAAGTSLPAIPAGAELQTFSTQLPIEAGDLIGIDPTHATDKIGISSAAGAAFAAIFPTPFDGSVVAPSEARAGEEIELSAEVQPQPEVALVTPSTGSITGGTVVTITGKNLAKASAVKFGSLPAANFTVDSDTQITATTPRGARPGKVDVSVTTIAGDNANTRFDDFVYRACVVPQLRNHTLGVAKRQLQRAGCKPGTVKKIHASRRKRGKVIKQHPSAGKVLAPGTRVRIKLGR